MKNFTPGILCALLIISNNRALSQNVWTQHNDQGRTGWYPYETTLNVNNVNTNTFGFNFSHTTDDKIVGQPLIVLNVNIPNIGFKNVVYVTTLNNTVYAYDADVNAEPYWQQNYTNKISVAPGPDCSNCRPAKNTDIHPSLCGGSYGDFSGNMGIVGAPVIDTATGTMYFVTKIVNQNDGTIDNHAFVPNTNDEYNYTTTGFHQYLHAIDITTGNERPNSPVEITATSNGTGDGQTTTNSGIIKFNPRTQFNRAGLALSNGIIYIAFAAHCDFNPSHGWIIGYNASTLSYFGAYNPTPNDGRGGVWMSGAAPAIDENGNLYITTGNSLNENKITNNYHTYNTIFASDPANRGEGVIKIKPDLTLSSYFTPFNYIALNQADKDFPIQMMLLPNTNLAMTGCKDGNIYVMDKTNLGGFDTVKNNNLQTVSMHSSFAYFGGSSPFAYQFSENTQLRAYPVSASGLGAAVINTTISGPSGGTGGFLSVSSRGTDPTTGILWAYQPITGCNANNNNCHGILRAVKANDIKTELWNSDMTSVDQIPVFNKFSCPAIALGKVYIAANINHFFCYGLKTNTTCITNVALNKPVTAAATSSGTPGNVTDGSFSTAWSGTAGNDANSVTIDLQSSFDICRLAITWTSGKQGMDFDLRISDDNTNWTTVNVIRGNTGVYSEFNGSVTARYVRMAGVKAGSASGYGINEFQVFGNTASPCRAPSGLSATTLTPNSEHISWNAISGAGQYIIKYRSNLSSSWLTRTTNTNAVDLTALTCGSVYYYTVQAVCGATNSGVSPGSFVPDGCPANTCDIFPVRYYNVDLGDIGIAGSTCKNGNEYTLTGSGTDIAGISDQFQFAYTNNDIADYDVFGRIKQQDQLAPFNNKLGIMVRDSLTNTSRFAFMASVDNGNHFIFESRDIPGGPVSTLTLPGNYTLPYWMKITKAGTKFTAYISPENISWTKVVNALDLHFGNDPTNIPNYGMAITSANNSALSTGKVDNFALLVSSTLPVRLLDFSAKDINHDHVLVNWATSMEHLTSQFEVQRSEDNNSFRTIARVNAVGESESIHYYSINDNNPFAGWNYYRLKETDKDGKFYLSPVVSVRFDEPAGIEMYPNPAGNFASISSHRDPILEVNVYDITGKWMQTIKGDGEHKTIHLNTADFAKGVYVIRIKTTTGVYRQKLFRQ
jgi:hypothetical protein